MCLAQTFTGMSKDEPNSLTTLGAIPGPYRNRLAAGP
jgi:hypothetical protein